MGLKYYSYIKYSPLSDLFIQASIETDNQLMDFYDSSWQDFPDTGRSTGSYMIFYKGGTIDPNTNVPGPVYQSSAESGHNEACTSGMASSHLRILIH